MMIIKMKLKKGGLKPDRDRENGNARRGQEGEKRGLGGCGGHFEF